MIFINYTDIIDYKEGKDGKFYEELVRENATIPIYIPREDITLIKPFMSTKGKLFKNVTIIRDKSDKYYRIMGNWKDIINISEGKGRIKGFNNEK